MHTSLPICTAQHSTEPAPGSKRATTGCTWHLLRHTHQGIEHQHGRIRGLVALEGVDDARGSHGRRAGAVDTNVLRTAGAGGSSGVTKNSGTDIPRGVVNMNATPTHIQAHAHAQPTPSLPESRGGCTGCAHAGAGRWSAWAGTQVGSWTCSATPSPTSTAASLQAVKQRVIQQGVGLTGRHAAQGTLQR